MKRIKDANFSRKVLITLALFLAGFGIFSIIFFIKGISILSAVDACFGTFAILFGFGCFSIILNFGTFDALAYNGANLWSTWTKKSERKYKDLYEYTQVHAEKRKKQKFNFLPFFISSAPFLIAVIILRIIMK